MTLTCMLISEFTAALKLRNLLSTTTRGLSKLASPSLTSGTINGVVVAMALVKVERRSFQQ